MIQRIQSIFLLCTAIIAGLMFFMPAATIVVPGEGVYEFYSSSVKMLGNQPEHYMATNWTSLILNIMIPLFAVRFFAGFRIRPRYFLWMKMTMSEPD